MKKLVRCEHGHFYDGAKYDNCPHCSNTKKPNETVFIGREYKDIMTDANAKNDSGVAVINSSVQDKKEQTMQYFQKSIGTEPVVGWLVCVKGLHFGEDFRIKSGRNFIGRSGNNHISLSADTSVSREKHAVLTYDAINNQFLIQPDDSAELCYLNDEPVLVPTKLTINDRITVGESELMFIPFCSDAFTWQKENS